MKTLLLAVAAITMVAAMGIAIDIGLARQAVVDCDTWQQQAKEYPAFYLTKDEAQECQSAGITVDAPIK